MVYSGSVAVIVAENQPGAACGHELTLRAARYLSAVMKNGVGCHSSLVDDYDLPEAPSRFLEANELCFQGYTTQWHGLDNNQKGVMKMKHLLMAVTGLALGLCSGFAVAQDDEKPQTFTYASYYYCTAGAEEGADKLMERNAVVLDKLVDDGAIKGWGWMSHHTGGKWRRIRWHQTDSIAGALEALDTIGDALTKKYGEDDPAAAEFAKACPQHDDYLWQVIDGGSGDAAGKVGFSVYYKCDIVREGRADEIFESRTKPILDKMVEEGGLTGWSWQSHVIGGHVRRLQTMAAKDLPTLLASRASLIQQMYPEDSSAARDFAEICGPHQDYIWNYDLGK